MKIVQIRSFFRSIFSCIRTEYGDLRISKRVFQENKAGQIFRKTNISYPLICTRRCACQGVKKCSFFAKLTCFVFLKHPLWDSQISVFSQNTEKYGPGKTPYLDTFHTVRVLKTSGSLTKNTQRLENNNSPKFQRFFLFLRNRIVKLGYCRVHFLSKSLIVC